MGTGFRSPAFVVLAAMSTVSLGGAARELSFEERVAAQRAIEQVHYAHQLGTTKPFDQAVPRAVLESKVRRTLEQTVALERYWKTPVTAEMLERELERMARGTRMPERLGRLFAALGHDPFLIQECLVRPVLVDRLVRGFVAFDERIHADSRREADALHEALLAGEIDPTVDHPRRRILELVLDENAPSAVEPAPPRVTADGRSTRLALDRDAFERWRGQLPTGGARLGPLDESRESYTVRVVLEDEPGALRVASFAVPKRSWDEWWQTAAPSLDETSVRAVASAAPLPPLDTTAGGAACGPDDTWHNGTLDDAPDPLIRPAVVWTGSLMIVWGGDGGYSTNRGVRYDPATDSWSRTSTVNAPTGGENGAAVWTGSEMLVWGGYAWPAPVGTGGRYDPLSDSWTPISTLDAPAARSDHKAVWTGEEMIVWGGIGDTGYIAAGGRYDPATDRWSGMATAQGPAPRKWHSAVWTGEEMIVWGGVPAAAAGTGGRYDPATDRWSPTSMIGAPAGRSLHSAVWTGEAMIVWGGGHATGGRYDPTTDTWAPTSTVNAPVARWQSTAVWTGTTMVVWGGHSGGSARADTATGGRYDPGTDTWTTTSMVGAPRPRREHQAVWTGEAMVVWGGGFRYYEDNVRYISSGGRYDPATDTWSPTSTGSGPEPRWGHTAVWTGSEMIVWGGHGMDEDVGSGGRYDPATDSWTPTSTVDAPPASYVPRSVWTGGEMLVWGGYDSSTGFGRNTGGRYDPHADRWRPTALDTAPGARFEHTAVWTGSEMIVWGGTLDFSTHRDDGARYDPASDAWVPLPPVDAFAARYRHSAVWTGSEMIVWGGGIDGGTTVYSDGRRYDPLTDSWTPTSLVDAPAARYRHTAVWTGSEMVVYGGFDLRTGGRYDPVSDSWSATSTTGAPGNFAPRGVWTGRRLVVWGEHEPSAAYDPVADDWAPMSTLNEPRSRQFHTAVWTGSFVAVWGGFNAGPVTSGGLYALGHAIDDDGDSFSECAGDCNDAHAASYPGAAETCDGVNTDCSDPAWPAVPADEADADLDGVRVCAGDCDDANAEAWATPGETAGLALHHDHAAGATAISWGVPAEPGASSVHYDLLRSGDAADFVTGAVCVVSAAAETSATDAATPAEGFVFFYLARAVNDCPGEDGSLGAASSGTPRAGADCP